jgi:hypothetical protein
MPPAIRVDRDCTRHESWLNNHEERLQETAKTQAVQDREYTTMASRLQDHEERLRIVEVGNLRLLCYASISFFVLSLCAQFILKLL